VRTVTCLCSARIEAHDVDALSDAYWRHAADAHPGLKLSEQRRADADAALRRTGGWDGQAASLGEVEILPLRSNMRDAYLAFFDHDAFPDNPAWAACYCLSYTQNLPPGDFEEQGAEQNRAARAAQIDRGEASGVVATSGGRIVGWCHAAPRTSLALLDRYPEFAAEDPDRTAAIVCFVVPPQYRGQGLARKLLEGACTMMRERGFAEIHAYPPKEDRPTAAGIYHGRKKMYADAGFEHVRDGQQYTVVRKAL
jgi:ribosomal protein S18 acetylase RimI-like enzyme